MADLANARFDGRLADKEFERVRTLLYDRFGIAVEPGKRSMVEGRISKLMRTRGYTAFAQLDDALRNEKSTAMSDFIDRLTTNHTFFWRESAHFEWMRDEALPEWLARLGSTRDLRVWCAAASTGEEPYTLAMMIKEVLGPQYGSWKAGVLATDISAKALTKAARGQYEAKAIAGLPDPLGSKYFDKSGATVTVKPSLRSEVLFKRFNLMSRPYRFKKPFHIVFCRNVMIYFDKPTIQATVKAMYDAIAPGGYLVVGHSEPLDRATCPFDIAGPSIYRRPA